MQIHQLDSIEARELVQGFRVKFVHSESMTFAYWEISEGAALPGHAHPHEQVVNMLDGRFRFTVNGETRVLVSGDVVVIPSNATHSGTALTDCQILDVFHPVREDYR